MNRWIGKVAVVTGASAGIGAAIAVELVKAGMIVIGAARRQERVDQLKTDIPNAKKINLHSFKCDVSKEEDIKALFKYVDKKFGGIDVLINNAGIVKEMNILDADNTDKIKDIIDVNLVGAALCCREAYQSMRKKGVDGHIILINSIAGHNVINFAGRFPSLNMYPSSKFAMTAMTEVLRQELQVQKTKTKITSISPGVVDTEIIPENFKEDFRKMPHLESKDIADAVLYVLGTPPHVQVHELMIKPVGEMF